MADVGIHAYVLKSEPLANLVAAIKEAQAGRPYNTPEVEALMRQQRLKGGLRERLPAKTFPILRLKFNALVHIKIGDHMSISHKTVETYTGHVTRQFKIPAAALPKFCVENGIVGIEWNWEGKE